MDNDAGVRELVEIMFRGKVTIYKEMTSRDSNIAKCLQNEDFLHKLEKILNSVTHVIHVRWERFFDVNYRKLLLSHGNYLFYIISACVYDTDSTSVFYGFIRVGVLLNVLSKQTLEQTGVNFSDLNPDIMMVLYVKVIKSDFCKHGGFHKFIEYIHDHVCIEQNRHSDLSNPDLSDLSKVLNSSLDLSKIKLSDSELRMDLYFHRLSYLKRASIAVLASEVLETTSIQLPTLPSEADLIMKVVAFRKKAEKIEKDRKLKSVAISKPFKVPMLGDSGTVIESEWCDRKIEAVIRHNHSKTLGHENEKNRTQEEADGVLERLKSRIKSLVEVLDEYDKE